MHVCSSLMCEVRGQKRDLSLVVNEKIFEVNKHRATSASKLLRQMLLETDETTISMANSLLLQMEPLLLEDLFEVIHLGIICDEFSKHKTRQDILNILLFADFFDVDVIRQFVAHVINTDSSLFCVSPYLSKPISNLTQTPARVIRQVFSPTNVKMALLFLTYWGNSEERQCCRNGDHTWIDDDAVAMMRLIHMDWDRDSRDAFVSARKHMCGELMQWLPCDARMRFFVERGME